MRVCPTKTPRKLKPTTRSTTKSTTSSSRLMELLTVNASVQKLRRLKMPYKLVVGVNDLLSQCPEIAAELLYEDPATLCVQSHKKLWWRCTLGHEYEMLVKSRTYDSAGYLRGCGYCSGRKILVGWNDLSTTHPEIAAQAYGWDPTMVSKGAMENREWICDLGHIWSAAPNTRTTIRSNGRGSRCSICNGNIVLKGFNDLQFLRPDLAAEAVDFDCSTVTLGSKKTVTWKCDEGHTWKVGVRDRVAGNGCRFCTLNNPRAWPGYNDLTTVNPKLASQAHGWDPTTITAGSSKRMEWDCECGEVYTAAVRNRSLGTGCPYCVRKGFNFSEPSYLYFLRHDLWGMLQIGITNNPEKRVGTHAKSGWEALEILGPEAGVNIYKYEQGIRKALKRVGADLGNKDIAGRFDGYTEAWVEESYPAKSLSELIELID